MRAVDVQALKAGDEAAFGAAWRTIQPRLLRFLRGLGATRDAEDLASVAWLEVVRALDQFEGDERDFRAWVFSIARNRLVDARRRQGRRPEVLEPALGEPMVSAEPDPAEHDDARVATEAALELIRTLSPDQAEVVLLRVIGELDVATVAGIVGKSPGAVRVLAHRGLRALAAAVAPNQDVGAGTASSGGRS